MHKVTIKTKVLHDGAAESEAVDGLAFVGASAEVLTVDAVAAEVLVGIIYVGRAFEVVRTRLRDGVHATADEVGLTHVERSHNHLHFLDSVHRDGVAAAGKRFGKTEVVVEVGSVDGEVGRASVAAGEAHAVGIRRHAGEVGDAAVHSGSGENLSLRDVGGGAGFLCRELAGTASDNKFAELCRTRRQIYVQFLDFTQLKHDVLKCHGLHAYIRHSHRVRAADAHTLYAVTAVDVAHRRVAGARRLVRGHNRSADYRLCVVFGDKTGHGSRGHLCYRGKTKKDEHKSRENSHSRLPKT